MAEVDYWKQAQQMSGDFEQVKKEQEEEKANFDTSWNKAFTGAFKWNTGTGAAMNLYYLDSQSGDPDPEFKLDDYKDVLEQELPGITNEEYKFVDKAHNRKHLDSLIEDRKGYRDYALNASMLGWGANLLTQGGAEFFNVPNYVPFLQFAKATTFGGVAKNAFGIGLMNATEEAAIGSMYGEKTASDLALAMTMGVTIGGGLGLLTKGAPVDAMAKNALESKMIKHHDVPNTGEYIKLDDFKVDDVVKPDVAEAMTAKGLNPDDDFHITVHAADSKGEIPKADRIPQTGTPFESLANRLQSSENPLTRYLAGVILEHPEKTVTILNKHTAALEADAMQDMLMIPYTKQMHTLHAAYGKAASGTNLSVKDFDSAIKLRLEGSKLPDTNDALEKILDDAERVFVDTNKQVNEYAKASGVEELLEADFDPKHMARYWDGEAMLDLAQRTSPEDVVQLLKDSIYKGGEFEAGHKKLMAEMEQASDLDKAYIKADNEAYTLDFEQATVLDKDGKELFVSKTTEKGTVKIPKEKYEEASYIVHNHPSGKPFSKGDLSAHISNSNIIESRIATKEHGSYVLRTLNKDKLSKIKLSDLWKDITSMTKKTDDPKQLADIYTRVINTKYRGILQFRKAKSLKTEKNFDALATRVAQSVYNRMTKRATRVTAGANLLAGKDQRMLMDSLDDLGLIKEDLDHVKAVLDAAGRDRKANARKPQIKLDMSTTRGDAKMTDLLGNSTTYGAVSNWRYWLGRSAVARHGKFLNSEEGIIKAINDIDKTGLAAKQKPEDILYEKEALIESFKQVLGRSPYDMSGKGATFMRGAQKAIAASGLNKLGLVQYIESGRAISAVTNNVFKFIPELAKLTKQIVTGKAPRDVFRDFEQYSVNTIGMKRFLNHPKFRADDYGYKMSKAEKALDKMSYFSNIVSGFHRVHDMQYGYVTNGLAQRWYKEINIGKSSTIRMNDVGLATSDLALIKAEFKHVTTRKGMFNNELIDNLNLDQWTPEVRNKFLLAIHRKTNNAVQSIMVGETPRWMNKPMGRFFGQFRSFSFAALGKQTTKDFRMIKHGDMEAAIGLFFMTATSAIGRLSLIHYNSLKKDGQDKKDYLKERLAPTRLMNDIAAYHGSLSLPVDIINAASTMVLGIDIGSGRLNPSKGIASLVPFTRYADNVIKGIGGLANPFTYNQADLRSGFSVFPYQGTWGVDLILDKLADFMPEER